MTELGTLRALKSLIKIIIFIWIFGHSRFEEKRRNKALERFFEVYNKEDYETALWHIDKYIEKKPKDAYGYLYKGCVLKDMERIDEAGTCFREAVSRKKKLYEAQKLLGDIYLRQGLYQEAIEQYTKAIKLEKRKIPPRFSRGVAHMQLENYDKAIKDLHYIEKKEKGDKTYIYKKIYSAYQSLGDEEKQSLYYNLLAE